MRLFCSSTSPYARKARVVVLERGLAGSVEIVACNPFGDPADLVRANPLGKVPALDAGGGAVLYDSPVICEYLDALAPPPYLLPKSGEARWTALRRQALADGLMDAAVLVVLERRRPEPERSAAWTQRQCAAIDRALDALEADIADFPEPFGLEHAAAGCALDYLDFRHPDRPWREGRPRLRAWRAAVAERPSFAATRPQ